MNKDILEKYRTTYNIDKILDSLSMKGTGVIDTFSSEMTNITNSNIDSHVPLGKICDMRILQIYDKNFQISNSLETYFKLEREFLKTIPNLDRALYIFMSPNSIIPEHQDDDDSCFRIIYGVNVPSTNSKDIGLVIEGDTLNFGFKEVIGVSSDVMHSGWNTTDKYWSVLTLCVEDNNLNDLRKIY